ncbi:hypothetical protein MAR_035026 [Mya arenaria]|uniref:Uncharacterized protein n=1 Tax=Mya arenaria TaxID=6604 RepID=A0ABY7EIY7_MYAAR|nr:hypothetical protein MAR_035026 [Mya arenaria]
MMKSNNEVLTITATLQHVVTCLGRFSEVSVLLCEKLSSNRVFLERSKQFLAKTGIFNRIHDNKVYKADDPGLLFLYYFLAPLLNIAARDDLVIEMKEVGFTDALKEFLSKEDPNIWMQVLTLLAESLQSIWLLCFDEKNKKEAVDNEKIGIVDLLLELQGDTDKDIARASRKALWTIRDELSKSKNRRYRRTAQSFEIKN